MRDSRCVQFSLGDLHYEYPLNSSQRDIPPASYLRQEVGVAFRRYPKGVPEKVKKLIEHELELIEDLEYEPFFLTVYDVVPCA